MLSSPDTATPPPDRPFAADKMAGYPRRGRTRWLRALLLVGGIAAVACMVGIVWQVLLALQQGNGGEARTQAGLLALLGRFGQVSNLYEPLWVDAMLWIGLALLLAGSVWAVGDVLRERSRGSRAALAGGAPIATSKSSPGAAILTSTVISASSDTRQDTEALIAADHEQAQAAHSTEVPSPPALADASSGGAASTGFVPRVFISHSGHDNDFGIALAARLERALVEHGGDVWYDRADLIGGDDWMRRIERELTLRNVFVVLLSPTALSSPWVLKEIRLALSYAISKRHVFIPVICQSVAEIPPLIKTYEYVSYVPSRPVEEAFRDLLKAVLLGESRVREEAAPLGARLAPPFDLGLLPPLDHFVGREAELHQVLQRLTSPPSHRSGLASVVAANGLGGIGKSTLAAMALLRLYTEGYFPEGLAVVRCNGLFDPAEVLAQVLERFGLAGEEVRKAAPVQARHLAQTALRGKDALVVLDNVEPHWPVEQVIASLRAAGVAVLATSRHVLPAGDVPEEATVEIELLSREESLELFAESYGRVSWDSLTSEERATAERIVDAVDRHTLAVVLAGVFVARRREGRELATIAGEYASSPLRRVDPVAAVINTSVDALPHDAQHLFALLGAFPTADLGRQMVLRVAETLGDPTPAISLEALEDFRLVDAALDTSLPAGTDRERVRLHLLVRDVARNAFRAWDTTTQQHTSDEIAHAYGAYGDELDLHELALGPDLANVVSAITSDAIERAHTQGHTEAVARMCHAIRLYWRGRGRTADLLRTLEWGVAAAEHLAAVTNGRPDLLRAAHLTLTYGQTLQLVGRMDDAEAIFQQNLTLRRVLRDRKGEGAVLTNLGQVAQRRGQLEAAEGYYRQALTIDREVQDRQGEGVDLAQLGQVAQLRGRLAEAEGYFQQSLAIRREVQDRRGEGVVLAQLGLIAEAREQLDEAERYYRDCLQLLRDVQDALNEATISLVLGQFLIARRDHHEDGCPLVMRAVALRRELHLPGVEQAVLTALQLGCATPEDLRALGIEVVLDDGPDADGPDADGS